jgi:hypothetical protein
MGEQFKVDEIAIGQNFTFSLNRNDMECEILAGPLESGICKCLATSEILPSSICYIVQWADGDTVYVEPKNLRKKRPPTTGEQAIRALFLVAPADRRATVESRAEYWAAYEYTHLMIACDVRGLTGAQK